MNNKVLIIGLAAVAVIGVVVLTMAGPKKQPEQAMVKKEVSTATGAPTTSMTNGTYKAGKYTSDGSYTSPAGPEVVTVQLAMSADGTITDVNFTGQTTNPNSKRFQGMFASGYKTLVMGKKIDEVKLDKVSGSSLTPMGFNDAIEKIKAQAKA